MNNILGSCNGLVCFGPLWGKDFLICNPVTGEIVYVPKHNSIEEKLHWFSGFGYCHSTNEYKIVIMHYEDTSQIVKVKVLVYTIGGGGWRSKGSIHIFPCDLTGVYANGGLHWLDRQQDRIVAFDLEDENFQYIPLPLLKHERYNHSLKLLGGNNLYMVHKITDEPCCMYIWTYKRKSTNASSNGCDMKQNYNDLFLFMGSFGYMIHPWESSWDWIKEFSIELEEMDRKDILSLNPLAITSNYEVLLCYKNNTIYCYDHKTSTKNKLFDGHDMGCDRIGVVSHANSLVSISSKDLQEVQPFKIVSNAWMILRGTVIKAKALVALSVEDVVGPHTMGIVAHLYFLTRILFKIPSL